MGDTLLLGWSLADSSRGRDARKYLLTAASVVPKSTGETQLGSVPGASDRFSQAASTHMVLGRNQQLRGGFSAGSRAGESKVAGCKPRRVGRQGAEAGMLGCKSRS